MPTQSYGFAFNAIGQLQKLPAGETPSIRRARWGLSRATLQFRATVSTDFLQTLIFVNSASTLAP